MNSVNHHLPASERGADSAFVRLLVVILAITLVTLSLASISPLLQAQCCSTASLPPGFTPYPEAEPGPRVWRPISELAAAEASIVNVAPAHWRRLAAGEGASWQVMMHPRFGTPSWISTPGIDIGIAPLDGGAASLARLMEFVQRHRDTLGIDRLADLELMRVSLTPNPSGQTIMGVDYKQTYRGYDVRTGTAHIRVKLRLNATIGRLSVMGSDWISNLECEIAPLPRELAIARAREELPSYAPGTGEVVGFQAYVLVGESASPFVAAPERKIDTRLVHQISFMLTEPTRAYTVILDANSGRLLRKHSDIVPVDVTGNVAAGTLDDGPTGPFVVTPMRDLLVDVTGGNSASTDAMGNFRISHQGSTPVTITGRLSGQWCVVSNKNGADLSFSQAATPGTAANVVMNGTQQNEFLTAETTAYRFTTATRHMLAQRIPRFVQQNGLAKLTTNVNMANNCNAFYTNNTINFFTSGGNCPNTAYEEVVAHEYGHAFHVWFHGGFQPLSFSEGIGDHLGLFLSGQRGIGRDFYGPGVTLRDYTQPVTQQYGAKDRQWQDPGCRAQQHCLGQAWAGCCMDLRDLLIAKYGQTQGVNVAETITIAQYDRNPADIRAATMEIFIQDDNDANLQNGTPNFKQIAKAADQHGIPRPPDPPTVQFQHVPSGDSRDTVNAYAITSQVTSQAGNVTGAWVFYRVNGGSFTSIAMSKTTGNTYVGSIPAQSAVSRVEYHLLGTDDKNNTERLPDVGENVFTVGQQRVFFTDSFETNKGWTAKHTATSGRFERADPIAFTLAVGSSTLQVQPENDTSANGTKCYVTQNGNRARSTQPELFDVDNGFTEIVSPKFDLSAVTAGVARLRYQRWFFTYNNNDDLEVEVSNDNGQMWTPIEKVSAIDNQWRRVEFPLSLAYTKDMVVRFKTADNPNNSVTDALIDDVAVIAFNDDVVELRANTRTPAIGTTVNYTLKGAKRPRSVWNFAISFTKGSTPIPGIGTLNLGFPFYLVALGQLDGQGNGAFGIPIPNVAALKGTTVYTEALVALNDAVLTNPWTIAIQ